MRVFQGLTPQPVPTHLKWKDELLEVSNDDVVVSRTLVKDERTKRQRPTANIAPSGEEKEAYHSQATRPEG